MFQTLDDVDRRAPRARIRALAISILIHAAFVAVGIVLPMIFLQVIPGMNLISLMAAPAPPAAPPPPPPPRPSAEDVPRKPLVSDMNFIPPTIPQGISAPDEEPNPVIGFNAVPSLLAGPVGVPAGIPPVAALLAPAPPAKPAPPPPRREVVPIGGSVQEAKLIRKVTPEYPSLAKAARAQGTVILEVQVDEEGNVIEVRVLRDLPLLTEAAVRAVRQWKYSPTLLNGEPVRVMSTVTVNFHLN
jgi:protein TonB